MGKSLEQLKKERDALLKKNIGRKSLENLSRKRALEKKQVEAEIRALKNPGSMQAKASLKNAGRILGGFIGKRARILSANINASLEAEERRAKKKPVARRKTTRRRIKRR